MKKIISLALVAVILFAGLFVLTGCEGRGNGNKPADNTTAISYTHGKGVFTVSVPKNEEGEAKYTFTTTKPEGAKLTGTFYLNTDTAIFAFSTQGLVYNTAVKYKEKFGETKATFDGYLDWMADSDSGIKLAGLEQFEINGRKAIRYYSREGSSSNYKYYGYSYAIGVDDIYPGSRAQVAVLYKSDEVLTEAKEFDEETLAIINSIKITPVETK